MISVLIATKDRPTQIRLCLTSILNNSYRDFEIIVVDQSKNAKTQAVVISLHTNRIRYFIHNGNGKTKAINIIIPKAKGNVLSFIDDDNVVSSSWLNSINTYLKKNKKIYGVFGTILPYQTNKHHGYICPSIFQLSKSAIITNPYIIHHQALGLGSNMSLRKEVFQRVGLFRPWLGPGNSGRSGGEDGELIYRILLNDLFLAYDPFNIVYHDRWLTNYQNRLLQTRYTAGEIAYLLFYTLNGDKHTRHNLFITLRERLVRQGVCSYIIAVLQSRNTFHAITCLKEIYYTIAETVAVIQGSLVGLYQFGQQ